MEKVTKGKLSAGKLRITGNATATGGSYDTARITGDGVVDGDIVCRELKCLGTMKVSGKLTASTVSIVGTAEVSSGVDAGSCKLSGTAEIGGDTYMKELNGTGTVQVKGGLSGERLTIRGQLTTAADCEAEELTIKGLFEVGGLLNAEKLTVKLYQDSWAAEIGGGRIRVEKASGLNPFHLFFKPSPYAKLHASVIEGDDIHLENTIADIVRGNVVSIGPGCTIGCVEYKESFVQKKDSIVETNQKV